ncbi:cob(I)yrinic acid a,c-diamide adenosyltransferase [Candidatus Saccharibacteria bacterium]|nr:cob(I)yrinic acid a,c-diamide adenosyltransferase [Candidatus Saccharibacteria bacterium]
MFDDYKQKQSVVVVYTGDSKGKTSASIGLMCRALGRGWRVAYIQFVKNWEVGEHTFIRKIQPLFNDSLFFYKGGLGFYEAPDDLSAADVTDADHKQAAQETLAEARTALTGGEYDLVICDEINNALHDGLLTREEFEALLKDKPEDVSLCLTGRNFPEDMLHHVDIATEMKKIKHHFDDKYLAKKGIDY